MHDIGENPDKKVGALNYGFALITHADYLLGVDGDTTLAADAVEPASRPRSNPIPGSVASRRSTASTTPPKHSIIAKLLIAGQRTQFAAFDMQNMLRGRNMAVLGGQCSIFSMRALRAVMTANHQQTPWVNDSEVEDSLLSLQIKSAGYLTKISATGAGRRRWHDHPALAGRPAGEMELRRHRPDVAGPARRHQGPAVPPEPAAALGGEPRHGDQHLHPDRLRPAARRRHCPSTPSCSRRSG